MEFQRQYRLLEIYLSIMRILLHIVALVAVLAGLETSALAESGRNSGTVSQWDTFELKLKGPSEGNPFLDIRLTGVFSNGDYSIEVSGFYDGDGTYLIRFMPDKP